MLTKKCAFKSIHALMQNKNKKIWGNARHVLGLLASHTHTTLATLRNSLSKLNVPWHNLTLSFQSLIHQPKNRGKDIRINLSSAIAESLQECLQNGAWQGINIRCSQYEEGTSRRESYAPFRPASRPRLQHQRSGDHTYESLLQLS